MNERLEQDFRSWADQALAKPIPTSVVAFNFNLYETLSEFRADLIGASRYNEKDSDWACDEIFVERDSLFRLPHYMIGTEWQQALEAMVGIVRKYVYSDSFGSAKLRAAQAVTVGFVDGDLVKVWPDETAELGAPQDRPSGGL